MSSKSRIEWTNATWNPVTGCSKVSPGCQNCYAESMAKRLQSMQPGGRYRNGFAVTVHDEPNVMEFPLRKKKPQMIFVNSMSDLFHGHVPESAIIKIMDVMRNAHWHIFQVLTKRPERMAAFSHRYEIPDNVWMGTSIEDNIRAAKRSDLLRDTRAKVRFVSAEPLLGRIDIDIVRGIDWVIAGGESGPNARPMDPDWPRKLRDMCVALDTPFFFKQWGEHDSHGNRVGKKAAGRTLDGKIWDQMPNKYNEWRDSNE